MNLTSPVLSAVTHAIATSVCLIGQCNEKEQAVPALRAELFARLRQQLQALPLDEAESCSLPNAVESSECMARDGEYLAARWQMVQLVRKLKSFRAGWERVRKPSRRRAKAAPVPCDTTILDNSPLPESSTE
jgi:hypothetical protein